MRFFSLLFTTAVVLAAPLLETKGKAIPGKWIVVMKENYEAGVASGRRRGATLESLVTPHHTYNMGAFKGYAMDASDETINKIAGLDDVSSDPYRENPRVRAEADFRRLPLSSPIPW